MLTCACGKLARCHLPMPLCVECAEDFYHALIEIGAGTNRPLLALQQARINLESPADGATPKLLCARCRVDIATSPRGVLCRKCHLDAIAGRNRRKQIGTIVAGGL